MPSTPLQDLRHRRGEPEVVALLELAVERFDDDAERDATIALYGRDDAVLLGWIERGSVLALMGGVVRAGGVDMLHLAVRPEHRGRGIARYLVARFGQVAGTPLHGVTDGSAVRFWDRLGADPQPHKTLPDGTVRHRIRLDHVEDPGPDVTWPQITAVGARHLDVNLPPEGNTLPLIPAPLRDEPVPAVVAEWILQTDEIGLLLQDLLPDRFPPTTPAVRPADRGWAPPTELLGWSADELPTDPDAPLPGLPAGVEVPVRVAELVVAAERIGQWLRAARQVRRWADERGHGDAPWID